MICEKSAPNHLESIARKLMLSEALNRYRARGSGESEQRLSTYVLLKVEFIIGSILLMVYNKYSIEEIECLS